MVDPASGAPRAHAARWGRGGREPVRRGLDAQAEVAHVARRFGWKCLEFRPTWTPRGWRIAVCGSDAQGFVDLLMLRDSRMICAEVKAGRSDPRPEQERWLNDLRSAGCEGGLWRIEAINEIVEQLR